jgi:hypothetical protein
VAGEAAEHRFAQARMAITAHQEQRGGHAGPTVASMSLWGADRSSRASCCSSTWLLCDCKAVRNR